ncbi:hypothetical protein, partial [Deinococcus aetherius]
PLATARSEERLTVRPPCPCPPASTGGRRTTYLILAREVYWPPTLPRQITCGSLVFSARAEAGLARTEDTWLVLWKAPLMSAVACEPHPSLLSAWTAYRRHRDVLRGLARLAHARDRLAMLRRLIAALTREADALARRIEEGAA